MSGCVVNEEHIRTVVHAWVCKISAENSNSVSALKCELQLKLTLSLLIIDPPPRPMLITSGWRNLVRTSTPGN